MDTDRSYPSRVELLMLSILISIVWLAATSTHTSHVEAGNKHSESIAVNEAKGSEKAGTDEGTAKEDERNESVDNADTEDDHGNSSDFVSPWANYITDPWTDGLIHHDRELTDGRHVSCTTRMVLVRNPLRMSTGWTTCIDEDGKLVK